MKDTAQLHICIQVTVMVNVWQGTDVTENVQRHSDGSDLISLRRAMPVEGSLDAADKVSFHLPLMAGKCAEALASRLSL